MEPLQSLNFKRWIDENRHLLKPPVGNKRVFQDGDFVIMVVGGPNARKDYHVDPGQEFFYQLEGDMVLKTIQDGKPVDVPIRAGERDGFQWYCENCGNLLYEEFFELQDIETQFPPLFERFYSNLALRTCSRCGTVMERKG
jgi:3-hydroxyanthranilate 3,4-dioxygenase